MLPSHMVSSIRTYRSADCIGQVFQKSLLLLREPVFGSEQDERRLKTNSNSKIVRHSGSGEAQPQVKKQAVEVHLMHRELKGIQLFSLGESGTKRI